MAPFPVGLEHRTEPRCAREQVVVTDRALAETAALLVLRKNAAAIWGDGEDA